MTIRKITTLALLLLVGVSVAVLIVQETGRPGRARVEAENLHTSAAAEPSHQVIVYYFHGLKRCPTCMKIETQAREAIDSLFGDQAARKQIVFKVINFEEAENEHFSSDYKLVVSSLILSDCRDGREVAWKNLDKIWDLVWERPAFMEYLRLEIGAFLALS